MLAESKISAERAVQALAERYILPSLVAAYANKWCLFAALKKLLSRGRGSCMATQMRWRMHEVSKARRRLEIEGGKRLHGKGVGRAVSRRQNRTEVG
jgi:hypothetical protein